MRIGVAGLRGKDVYIKGGTAPERAYISSFRSGAIDFQRSLHQSFYPPTQPTFQSHRSKESLSSSTYRQGMFRAAR